MPPGSRLPGRAGPRHRERRRAPRRGRRARRVRRGSRSRRAAATRDATASGASPAPMRRCDAWWARARPAAEARDPCRAGLAEHGTVGAGADPAEEHLVGSIEPHHRAELGQEPAGGRLGDQSATTGDDHRTGMAERILERGELEVAEVRLAVGRDDRRRRASRARLDLAVQVDGRPSETLRDQGSDGALARSRQTDQGDAANRAHRSRLTARRCAAAARRTSPRLSPPNFSIAAAARTHASIASATTAPAGTTQMSLRS